MYEMKMELVNWVGVMFKFEVVGTSITIDVIAKDLPEAQYKIRQMFLNSGPANLINIDIDGWE